MRTRISAKDRLISIAEVKSMLGVSRPTLYRWIASGRFPKAIALGPQVRRWLKSAVEKWLGSKKIEGMQPYSPERTANPADLAQRSISAEGDAVRAAISEDGRHENCG